MSLLEIAMRQFGLLATQRTQSVLLRYNHFQNLPVALRPFFSYVFCFPLRTFVIGSKTPCITFSQTENRDFY